jgi:glycosyltransferase involved in cell wall biosynthesis
MYNNLQDNCDMWTQFAYELCKDGYGEIWYWGGRRTVKYTNNFIERWLPDFRKPATFQPTVIFARGGFLEYDNILKHHKSAYKIYYGAGRRFYPTYNFKNYKLILNDTPEQIKRTKKLFPAIKVYPLIKPAAENIFCPMLGAKKYDIIFVANEHKTGCKGHDFILQATPSHLKILQVGLASKKLRRKYKHVTFTGWVARNQMSSYYSQAKVAVVSCEGIDSSPRVIPEALACNCPVVVTDKVQFWKSKYINPQTGVLCSREDYSSVIQEVVDQYERFNPYFYYKTHLSLHVAVQYIKMLVGDSL